MILFHFFLIVTILFPVALGADSSITCTNETKIEGWKICCDGGIYNINDPISSVESCDVEPENANLSFADSAWLAYDCNSEYLQAAEQVCTFGYVNSTGVSAGMYWDVTQDFIKRFSSMILARESFVSAFIIFVKKLLVDI
ncbi:unnamed protein product [Allacma fusca]|uniref:Uncharacterized protein n=1 Tax=Allacma fusca TaxID=39272 RepID=A0A8J2NQC3_9HEXA|nr:unnamed protein product [Allacma fusca]